VREPSTRRGRDTRRRIIVVAAELMYERGLSATSIEGVLAASATGKSQFYHYFSSREELLGEVLDHQLDLILEEQNSFPLATWGATWGGIHAWLARAGCDRGKPEPRGGPATDSGSAGLAVHRGARIDVLRGVKSDKTRHDREGEGDRVVR
jgi:AcrR family transcriptional regulator